MDDQASYAIVLIDPGDGRRSADLREMLKRRLRDLGLGPKSVAFLTPDTLAPEAGRRALAAVYFGDDARDDQGTACAARFVAKRWPILPIVPTLSEFQRWVPEALYTVNGMENDLDRAVNVLLAQLGLVRRRRRLFISYLRRESTGVARQLAADLLERGYEVFLDTTSVEEGERFQEVLREAIVDTDTVVFLDSGTATSSPWVAEELNRAADLGVTILHLVWPGHERDPLTELAEAEYLEAADFAHDSDPLNHEARLTKFAAQRIAAKVESLRAQAWRLRRAHLVEGFVRQVAEKHGPPKIDLALGAIRFTARGRDEPIVVRPIHGVPRSLDWHAAHEAHPEAAELRLLYQGFGIGETMIAHIRWLDEHLPSKSLALEETETWLDNL